MKAPGLSLYSYNFGINWLYVFSISSVDKSRKAMFFFSLRPFHCVSRTCDKLPEIVK